MRIELNQNLKTKPVSIEDLPFGRTLTDHMLLMDYSPQAGWHDLRIVPYAPLMLDPATSCMHYGQAIFEGMKAYRTPEDKVVLFRPKDNFVRMNISATRMCIPNIDPDEMLAALMKLLEIEKDWVPSLPSSSLYIRPFMIATDPALGLRPSETYQFLIILAPVGPYYNKGGITPVRIFVEEAYVRAVKGGTGYAKCAGNYAGSMRSQMDGLQQGFDQVLWLDGIHRKYIEEVGAMNVFFVVDGKVVTPEINGSILPGITRKSIIEILRDWGMTVEERPITIDELVTAYDAGKVQEAFGCGTAVVVAPIGELVWGDKAMKLSGGNPGELTVKVYDELTGIQFGSRPDTRGWVKVVC